MLNFDPYEWSKKSDEKTEIVMWDRTVRSNYISNYMLSTRQLFTFNQDIHWLKVKAW